MSPYTVENRKNFLIPNAYIYFIIGLFLSLIVIIAIVF